MDKQYIKGLVKGMSDAGKKTRDLIFDKSIELFSRFGYENVSMKQIASSAGIRPSSIYNHFTSKTNILDEIYAYYEKYYFSNCRTEEEIQVVLETGSADDIVKTLAWTFYGMPPDMHRNMGMITKIIYSRFLIDERAKEIFSNTMEKAHIARTEKSMEILGELGRIHSGLDTRAYSEIQTYISLMTGMVAIVNEVNEDTIHAVGKKDSLKDMLAKFLAHYIESEVRPDV